MINQGEKSIVTKKSLLGIRRLKKRALNLQCFYFNIFRDCYAQ